MSSLRKKKWNICLFVFNWDLVELSWTYICMYNYKYLTHLLSMSMVFIFNKEKSINNYAQQADHFTFTLTFTQSFYVKFHS